MSVLNILNIYIRVGNFKCRNGHIVVREDKGSNFVDVGVHLVIMLMYRIFKYCKGHIVLRDIFLYDKMFLTTFQISSVHMFRHEAQSLRLCRWKFTIPHLNIKARIKYNLKEC